MKITVLESLQTKKKERLEYEAPECQYFELETESAILSASNPTAPDFGDGGSYDRFDYEW